MLNTKSSSPRLLLARLRKGDYAHAGDTEAIDIMLSKLSDLATLTSSSKQTTQNKALDVGCGLGGTAEYVRKHAHFDVEGIDIDSAAITHGRTHYPKIRFFDCDVLAVDKVVEPHSFDLIYLFNVFYALPQQKDSLQHLANVAKPGTILAIFDYTLVDASRAFDVKDLSGKTMNPIVIDNLRPWLDETGWDLIEILDLSGKYKQWYEDFLIKLHDNKISLLENFTKETFNKVHDTFTTLLTNINNKTIGGSMAFAVRR